LNSKRQILYRVCPVAAVIAVALALVLPGLPLRAGGNTQFRNPSNLSEVFDKTWDDRMLPVTWVMSQTGLPGSGIDNPTLIAELTAAFDSWEALSTSKLDYEFGGEVPIDSVGLGGPLGAGVDGRNLVTLTDPGLTFPPGVLAVALTFSFSNDTVIDSSNSDLDGDAIADIPEGTYLAGTIFDGDIAFNNAKAWETSGANNTIDIRAVALHEIGHAFGLSHSMVRDAVMFPFLDNTIIAYASFFYPQEPAYSSTFGAITGQVINGFSSAPVLGAHVYAVDSTTGAMEVGAYSADDGSYTIPGLSAGTHLVAIEPLDGDPAGLDPSRVNQVIQFTFDTGFPEEFYDANEANVEADPQAALAVSVTAGADTTAIDLVTNTVAVPGVAVVLDSGYNLFSYPVEVPAGVGAFDLLQALGDATEVRAVDRYDTVAGSFQRARYVNGTPAGVDFPLQRGEGYIVHMLQQKVIDFQGTTDCPSIDLVRGLNLIGIPCPPAGYTSHQLLPHLGARFEIDKLESFDATSGTFKTTQYDLLDQPVGDDFTIGNGAGYVVSMLGGKSGLVVPPPGSQFPPVITGLSPGQGVAGGIVVILGEGFDPDPSRNVVTFNGIGASVVFATANTLTVTVPGGASTGLVRATVNGLQSNAVNFDVLGAAIAEDPGNDTPLASGQTATGNIAADGEQDRYTFTALAGSLVTVSATSTVAGVPDLVLLLEDPFGVAVAVDDNGGFGTDPRINNFELSTTGTHTIVVSNVPGSGLGGYDVTLTVTPRSTAPQISILGGNFQTGLNGSMLPTPLSVLITGATGAPVAGSSVTFVASNATFGGFASAPANFGTSVMESNSSGVVQVDVTLPGTPGTYTITVTVPGVPGSSTFTVAATDKPVATVDMFGDNQDGTVNMALTNPLEVVLKDSIGDFVGNALVAFDVVAGGGTITGSACSGGSGAVCFLTADTDGKAGTTFTLGKKIDEQQIVAAYVPGRPDPILFTANPEAGDVTRVESNRSTFSALTLGTAVLNAITVQLFDEFDNPVEGQTVTHTPGGGLQITSGLGPNGQVFAPTDPTNADGIHVAAVLASEGQTDPTKDEFGASIGGGVYIVTAEVNGISESFSVDVDMGPNMVTWSGQNLSYLYGQPAPNPVVKRVIRWQRDDTFVDIGGGVDEDNGEFIDEDFNGLSQVGVAGVVIDLEAVREDREDPMAFGFAPMTLSTMQVTTDAAGFGSVDVTDMGKIGGVNGVNGHIDSIYVEWKGNDGAQLHEQTFTDENQYGERTNLIAVPVVITIDLADADAGIDLATVTASLNMTLTFFDPAAPPAVLPGFPEPMLVKVGGVPLTGLDSTLINDSSFHQVQIVYYPAATRLTGSNTVKVTKAKDNAENEQDADEETTFTYP